ncbi:MAG: 2-oxo acid dehydrogenase subunit E2 [Nitrospirae bacterium]|nr:MAG: 2-oxo acid dehydrogenase subunit E2 [Nitrospirota bacterium]
MASRVVMPKLTDTMEEGVVVKWKKREGDVVGSGDVLAEIETDKAVMDLEAFASGTLRRVLVNEGTTVKAGALIAVIAEPDEDISSVLADSIAPAAGLVRIPESKIDAASRSASSAPGPPSSLGEEKDRIKASPRAKAMAAERGIDLSSVTGSGPGGRIVEEDVMKAGAAGVSRATGATDRPLSQMRKAIARTTIQSKAPVPHFYLTTDIAMEEAETLRAQLKQSRRSHPSLTDMIVKAAALALARHPEINVSYAGDRLRQHGTIDIGIAVGLDDGLIAPVLRDCGSKTLEAIATESRELIERARNKRLQPHEYSGATFSVSNLGMFDVENFIAIIMPPEAAAIAVGSVRDVVVAVAGDVKAGRRMKVTLSCDHRALDGVQGAKFLKEFKRILEHPQELIQT